MYFLKPLIDWMYYMITHGGWVCGWDVCGFVRSITFIFLRQNDLKLGPYIIPCKWLRCHMNKVWTPYRLYRLLLGVVDTKVEPLPCWNRKQLVFATSIEPGQPVCPCSLTRLFTVDLPAWKFSPWYPIKWKLDSAKNGWWIISFKVLQICLSTVKHNSIIKRI